MDPVATPQKMTKQDATRQQVLELIDRLWIGAAIPRSAS